MSVAGYGISTAYNYLYSNQSISTITENANYVNPDGTGGRLNQDMAGATANSVSSGCEKAPVDYNRSNAALHYDENQDALIQLAKEVRKGTTTENANILMEWAEEYNVLYHGIEVHPNRPGPNSQIPHFHIGKTGHIPITGD